MSVPKSTFIADLLKVADAYCAVADATRPSVSKTIFQRSGILSALESGKRDIATGTLEAAMRWFAGRWPEGAEWPRDVPRPEIAEPAE